jgi:hydrogenase nickel incorporation protein HypA/HybF
MNRRLAGVASFDQQRQSRNELGTHVLKFRTSLHSEPEDPLMHELSLAASIAEIVHRHARGRRVTRIEVAVGHLRQAVPSALSFGFEVVSVGTPLEGATLAIRQVPVRGRCRACGVEVEPEAWPLACPACSSFEIAVTGGEELCVEAIEVEDGNTASEEQMVAAALADEEEERRLLTITA